MITYKAEIEFETLNNGVMEPLATWTRHTKIKEAEGRKIEPARRFFRIGTNPVIYSSYSIKYRLILFKKIQW